MHHSIAFYFKLDFLIFPAAAYPGSSVVQRPRPPRIHELFEGILVILPTTVTDHCSGPDKHSSSVCACVFVCVWGGRVSGQ